jgi:hypothetical protein
MFLPPVLNRIDNIFNRKYKKPVVKESLTNQELLYTTGFYSLHRSMEVESQ